MSQNAKNVEAPGSALPLPETDSGVLQDRSTVGGANPAVVICNDTIPASPSIPQNPSHWLWYRCGVMPAHVASLPPVPLAPQPCPACAGGQLEHMAVWDMRTEATPAKMLAHRVVLAVLA